jgi:transposase
VAPTKSISRVRWWTQIRFELFLGAETGPNPTDRGKSGTKHHLITDAHGIPLAITITAANRNDITQLLPLVDAIPPIAGKRGRPRRHPDCVQGDQAYDSQPHRRQLCPRHIVPVPARRRTEHGSGLGVHRWPVEWTIAWLFQHRRLRIRYERRPDIHEALCPFGGVREDSLLRGYDQRYLAGWRGSAARGKSGVGVPAEPVFWRTADEKKAIGQSPPSVASGPA